MDDCNHNGAKELYFALYPLFRRHNIPLAVVFSDGTRYEHYHSQNQTKKMYNSDLEQKLE